MSVTSLLSIFIALQAPTIDLSTPESTVRSFVARLNAGDAKGAHQCLSTTKAMDSQGAMMIAALNSRKVSFKIESLSSTVSGDRASVSVRMAAIQGLTDSPRSEELKLLRSDKAWRILVLEQKEENKDNILNGLAGILDGGMQGVFARAKSAAQRTSALSNAKQIALAVLLYASDHKDKLPSKGDWKKAIFPYTKTMAIFRTPGIKNPDKVSDFEFNAALAGISQTKISDPAKTVMIYLGKAGKLNFAYEGKTIVAFCDGHCKTIDATAAKSLRWKP